MQPQLLGRAEGKAGSDSPVVADAAQLSDAHVDGVPELAVSTSDAEGQVPPQVRAMQALSDAEEAVALGVFSASRYEAYHAPAPAFAGMPDNTKCRGARTSPSESSRHSVSCAGMGGQGMVDNDGDVNGDGGAERERDNAWMDEYRRGAVSRCVPQALVSRCALATAS